MKFTLNREQLVEPLQFVCSVIERRQTAPILGHLLLVAADNRLVLTGTDNEIELVASIEDINLGEAGEITLPGRKFLDICQGLQDAAEISVKLGDKGIEINSGRFRSRLNTLPAANFPAMEQAEYEHSLTLPAKLLNRMLQSTAFAMAEQDVRQFYNGVLLAIQEQQLRLVATNSQKLATIYTDTAPGKQQAIIPRKAVAELLHLLNDADDTEVVLTLAEKQIRAEYGRARLICTLIEATYPDYTRAIPVGEDRVMLADREALKTALTRIAIFTNELSHGVRLSFAPEKLTLYAHNALQEEAEEILAVDYQGPPLEMQCNVHYLIEILSVIAGDKVRLTIRDITRACLLEDAADEQAQFLITPMK